MTNCEENRVLRAKKTKQQKKENRQKKKKNLHDKINKYLTTRSVEPSSVPLPGKMV
jgi:hypothetical protein